MQQVDDAPLLYAALCRETLMGASLPSDRPVRFRRVSFGVCAFPIFPLLYLSSKSTHLLFAAQRLSVSGCLHYSSLWMDYSAADGLSRRLHPLRQRL